MDWFRIHHKLLGQELAQFLEQGTAGTQLLQADPSQAGPWAVQGTGQPEGVVLSPLLPGLCPKGWLKVALVPEVGIGIKRGKNLRLDTANADIDVQTHPEIVAFGPPDATQHRGRDEQKSPTSRTEL